MALTGSGPGSAEPDRRDWRFFRQPHYLQSRGRIVLEEELPDVLAALVAAGALRFDPLRLMPPGIVDRTPRDGDERFKTVTARRAVLEQVLARAADAEPGLEVRRGVSVRELVARPNDEHTARHRRADGFGGAVPGRPRCGRDGPALTPPSLARGRGRSAGLRGG